jgi:hypothetical protein
LSTSLNSGKGIFYKFFEGAGTSFSPFFALSAQSRHQSITQSVASSVQRQYPSTQLICFWQKEHITYAFEESVLNMAGWSF